jgi:hypothetical protein
MAAAVARIQVLAGVHHKGTCSVALAGALDHGVRVAHGGQRHDDGLAVGVEGRPRRQQHERLDPWGHAHPCRKEEGKEEEGRGA